MQSDEKCLYCEEVISPGLDFQNECAKNIEDCINNAYHEIPITAKAKKEFAGYVNYTYSKYDNYGRYVGERQGKRKSYYKTHDKLIDKSALKSLKHKSLKGPLCHDCGTEFLEQITGVCKRIKTKGTKDAIERSIEKIKKKHIKILQNWKNSPLSLMGSLTLQISEQAILFSMIL